MTNSAYLCVLCIPLCEKKKKIEGKSQSQLRSHVTICTIVRNDVFFNTQYN